MLWTGRTSFDAKNGLTARQRSHCPQKIARCTIKYPRIACRYLWTPLDSISVVFGDAHFAGCFSSRKSTVGGVVVWSGQFVIAWSNTMGVLALGSGEFELAAVLRAATEGLGLRSILSDFDLCGHVTIKSDATAAIGTVHPLGLGKVRHPAVGDFWVLSYAFVLLRIMVLPMVPALTPTEWVTAFLIHSSKSPEIRCYHSRVDSQISTTKSSPCVRPWVLSSPELPVSSRPSMPFVPRWRCLRHWDRTSAPLQKISTLSKSTNMPD